MTAWHPGAPDRRCTPSGGPRSGSRSLPGPASRSWRRCRTRGKPRPPPRRRRRSSDTRRSRASAVASRHHTTAHSRRAAPLTVAARSRRCAPVRLPLFAITTLALWSVAASSPAQNPSGAYNPLEGLDADGRIPKPKLPDDLEHPERWRYTPPGRIKPGGVFDRFLVSSFLTPIVFSEQDIGFGGGFALTDVDFRDQRYREFANILATYSSEGQQAYRTNWSRWLEVRDLDNGGVLREERGRLYGRLGYEKTLTRRFFGIGSETPESAETSYTEELSAIGFGLRVSLPDPGSDWLLRTDLQAEHHGLSKGRVSGVPSTEEVFPSWPRPAAARTNWGWLRPS